jgi:glucose-1-phosphate cytidylyltransferase
MNQTISFPSVVILCGGEGTRLKEETEFRPKPLVMVGNKPIIWHIMKTYAHYGFNHFVLTLGYKGSMIKEYFLNARAYNTNFSLDTKTGDIVYHTNNELDDFRITFVETGLNTNTGERVRIARPYIKGDYFLLTYGDGVSDVDITKLLAFHHKKKKLITLTGVHPTSKYGQIMVGKDMLAKRFRQKPVLNDFVNGGFMVIDKKVLKLLKPGLMIEDDIIRLAKKKQVAVFDHNGFWQAVDTYKELIDLNTVWTKSAPWKVWT